MTSKELQQDRTSNLAAGRREPRPDCHGCRWNYLRTLHGVTESYCTFTKHNAHHADLKFGRIILTSKIRRCPMALIKRMAVSREYLSSRYKATIDDSKEPVWTDKHIEELTENFYIIPKK